VLHHLQPTPLPAGIEVPEGLQPVLGLQHHQWRNLLHFGQDGGAEPGRDRPLPQPELCNLSQGLCPVLGLQHDSGRAVLQRHVQQVVRQDLRAKRGLHGPDLLQVRAHAASQSDGDFLGRSSLCGNALLHLLFQLVQHRAWLYSPNWYYGDVFGYGVHLRIQLLVKYLRCPGGLLLVHQ